MVHLEEIIHPQPVAADHSVQQHSRTAIARQVLAKRRHKRLLKMQHDNDSSFSDNHSEEWDSDYRECSLLEKYELVPLDSEDDDPPTFPATSGNKLHPALRQIFLGNYEILLTTAWKYVSKSTGCYDC